MKISAAVRVLVLGGVAASLACATPKTIVTIPPCADRVEVNGEATRVSQHIFVLDHTFELPLSTTVLVFDAAGRDQRRELVSTRVDPLRFFLGASAGVAGALLLANASAASRRGLPDDVVAARALMGSTLLAGGALAAGTGWHPPQREVSFLDACTEPAAP